MKVSIQGLFVMALLVFTQTSNADTVEVRCVGPVGSGTSVSGELILLERQDSTFEASGVLVAKVAGEELELDVKGMYDTVGGEYAVVGALNNENIQLIYLNFTDDEESSISYIEYKSEQYPMTCQ